MSTAKGCSIVTELCLSPQDIVNQCQGSLLPQTFRCGWTLQDAINGPPAMARLSHKLCPMRRAL